MAEVEEYAANAGNPPPPRDKKQLFIDAEYKKLMIVALGETGATHKLPR
jgi:hypothetical protein